MLFRPGQITEVLAPLVDRRIPVKQAPSYLHTLRLLHRMATHLDGDDPTPPSDVVGLQAALTDQLRRDGTTPWVWDAWAIAACSEDDAERPTVSARVLEWLEETETAARRTLTPNPDATHHAGALHTNGYLCSSLWTKHGWKRTRWIGGGIAAAAGIDQALLQPRPPSGTLLANATTLAARLLGWDPPASGAWTADVHPTARCVGRVVEVATSERTSQGEEVPLSQPATIRSSLFQRGDAPANRAPNLLVYTVTQGGTERLVTMFDAGDDKVSDLLNPATEGETVEIRLRYNAVLDGAGSQFTGSRSVERA